MRIEPRQTWDEFCAEQDREQARENAAILAYKQQMRDQKPGMYVNGWKLLKFFITIAGIVALPFLLVYGIAAWFGL